jgi:hypothetical protein
VLVTSVSSAGATGSVGGEGSPEEIGSELELSQRRVELVCSGGTSDCDEETGAQPSPAVLSGTVVLSVVMLLDGAAACTGVACGNVGALPIESSYVGSAGSWRGFAGAGRTT